MPNRWRISIANNNSPQNCNVARARGLPSRLVPAGISMASVAEPIDIKYCSCYRAAATGYPSSPDTIRK
jgi:hypothetical protein